MKTTTTTAESLKTKLTDCERLRASVQIREQTSQNPIRGNALFPYQDLKTPRYVRSKAFLSCTQQPAKEVIHSRNQTH